MPIVYDPAFYAGLIKALGLRENIVAEVPHGIPLVIDVGQLLSNPPPIPISNVMKGALRVFNPAAPAAGTDFSASAAQLTDIAGVTGIGSGKRWRLIGFSAQLATSVTVATRQMGLRITTPGAPGGVWIMGWDVTGVPASSNMRIVFVPRLAAAGLTLTQPTITNVVPTIDGIMELNWAIGTNTQGLQVGDGITNIWLAMEEF